MTDIEKYTELKRKVEVANQKYNKAVGATGQLLKQLKSEFDCSTLEQAKEKLKKLKKQEQTSEAELKEALQKFEDKWNDRLNPDEKDNE